MLIIATIIKLLTRPVLFKQTRHGLRGEKFQVLKFRTMTVCENGSDIKQATATTTALPASAHSYAKPPRRTAHFECIAGQYVDCRARPHIAHNEEYAN